jgi:hypothetical protein
MQVEVRMSSKVEHDLVPLETLRLMPSGSFYSGFPMALQAG